VTNTGSWDRVAARATSDPAVDVVRYGAEGPTEDELRLLGDVRGKRVLDLGCGVGQAAIALARQGASVIAVDASARMLDRAKTLAERHEARVEWHEGDLADLAFLRADSIDLAFSAFAVGEVEGLGRLLRQVNRVLRNRAPFVFSHEHPMALCVGREPPETPTTPIHTVVVTSYFGDEPVMVERDGEPVLLYHRSIGEVFTELNRASFRVEVIVEPRPDSEALVPNTIVWRARKEGI
jgi:ubiquinone/menaquinone biosynthesis C-methylase UbiE